MIRFVVQECEMQEEAVCWKPFSNLYKNISVFAPYTHFCIVIFCVLLCVCVCVHCEFFSNCNLYHLPAYFLDFQYTSAGVSTIYFLLMIQS